MPSRIPPSARVRARRPAGWLVLGALLITAFPAAGRAAAAPADSLLAARDTLAAALAVRQRTQRERDAWREEKASLVAEYRRRTAELRRRRRERDRLREGVAVLEKRLAALDRQEREARRLRSALADTLDALLADLERAVDADLPFLPDERRARLADLAALLADPAAPAAERLRRLLEALQVEAAYGASPEVSLQRISLDGRERQVQVLRLGRVALLWLTPDGSRCGRYDPAAGGWTELPDRWRRPIAEAVEMAARRRPLDLVTLPLGRVAP